MGLFDFRHLILTVSFISRIEIKDGIDPIMKIFLVSKSVLQLALPFASARSVYLLIFCTL